MKTYRSEWFLAPANDYSEYWTSTQVIYWRGSTLPGEGACVANSEEEAEREIDDAIIMEQGADIKRLADAQTKHFESANRMMDQLRIARQCIEACKEEFQYRANAFFDPLTSSAINKSMAKLCTTALSNLPAFDVSAEAKNIDDVLKQVNENTK